MSGTGAALDAVLFDMDGLLVDTEPLWFVAESEVMARLGAAWTHRDQEHCLGGSLERSSRYMLAKAEADLPWQTVGAWLVDGMGELLRAGVAPRPGAAALLAELTAAGMPCALVSNSRRVIVDAVLASVGAEHFAATISADDVTRVKPDPEPYLTAARRLDVVVSRCVVLEDSPAGVASAQAAGCRVVAVPSLTAIEAGPGRIVVPSLEQVTLADLAALARADPHAPAAGSATR